MGDIGSVTGAPQPSARGRWGLRLVGLVVLVLLLRRLDLAQVAAIIMAADFPPLFAAILLTVPFFAFKIWRWRVILWSMDIEISNWQALRLYGAGLFIGQLTPGQLGELVRAPLLWRRGYSPWLVAGSVVVDRLLDLLLLAIVAMPVLLLLPGGGLAVVVVTGLIGVSVGVWPRVHGRLAAGSHRRPWLQAALSQIDQTTTMLGLIVRVPKAVPVIGATTALALAFNFVRLYLLLLALRLTLPVPDFIFGVALASLAGLLPITVAGIGTRDLVLAMTFRHAGQPVEGAVAFSAMILVVGYGLNLVWGGPAWLLETR